METLLFMHFIKFIYNGKKALIYTRKFSGKQLNVVEENSLHFLSIIKTEINISDLSTPPFFNSLDFESRCSSMFEASIEK